MSKPSTSHSYLVLTAGALAAALSLAACGPTDGTATAAVAAAQTAPASLPQPAPVAPVAAVAPVAPVVPAAPAAPVAQVVAPRTVAVPPQTVRVAQSGYEQPRRVASATLGKVRSIDPIRTRPQGSGAGAVVGGVLGAVIGNQIGSGNGRTAATVLGAVGGGVAGNNVERNHKEGVSGYRVRVEFDNGDSRTYEESHVGDLRVGDRVRVDGGQIRRV